jgi:hypothetical protein
MPHMWGASVATHATAKKLISIYMCYLDASSAPHGMLLKCTKSRHTSASQVMLLAMQTHLHNPVSLRP